MLEFARAGLRDFHVGHEGENNISRISLFQMGFDSEGIGGVDENTRVLGCNNGFNDGGQVVDIGQGFDAENDIVVCVFTGRSFFGSTND